jgi:hypothetical protein
MVREVDSCLLKIHYNIETEKVKETTQFMNINTSSKDEKKPEIYFHVGLERTGTTFLHKSVFPKFKGIRYISKQEFKDAPHIIRASNNKRFLLSKEFYNSDITPVVQNFVKKYPQTRIIIVLRRQDYWITSQYKRKIKNGFLQPLNKFIDIHTNKGLIDKNDLFYFPILNKLYQITKGNMLVMFYNDLEAAPVDFVDELKDYVNVESTGDISYKPRHVSYSLKQLYVKLWVNKNSPLKELKVSEKMGWRKKSILLYNKLVRYFLFSLSKLIPARVVDEKKVIPPDYINKIRKHYADDWERSKEFVDKINDENPTP